MATPPDCERATTGMDRVSALPIGDQSELLIQNAIIDRGNIEARPDEGRRRVPSIMPIPGVGPRRGQTAGAVRRSALTRMSNRVAGGRRHRPMGKDKPRRTRAEMKKVGAAFTPATAACQAQDWAMALERHLRLAPALRARLSKRSPEHGREVDRGGAAWSPTAKRRSMSSIWPA